MLVWQALVPTDPTRTTPMTVTERAIHRTFGASVETTERTLAFLPGHRSFAP